MWRDYHFGQSRDTVKVDRRGLRTPGKCLEIDCPEQTSTRRGDA